MKTFIEFKETNEAENLPTHFQIGDKVELDFYEAGKLKNCEVLEVNLSDSDVTYDIVIKVKGALETIISQVDAEFVKEVV